MPFLLGLIAAIGVVGVVLWRMQQATHVVREATAAVDDARGLFRRFLWMRKSTKSPLEMVDDPREAATAMMVAVAEFDGALTETERMSILKEMDNHFDLSGKAADDLFARARWLVRDASNLDQVLKRLAAPIDRACSSSEKRDLIAMLRGLAGAAQSPAAHAVDGLERRLLDRR